MWTNLMRTIQNKTKILVEIAVDGKIPFKRTIRFFFSILTNPIHITPTAPLNNSRMYLWYLPHSARINIQPLTLPLKSLPWNFEWSKCVPPSHSCHITRITTNIHGWGSSHSLISFPVSVADYSTTTTKIACGKSLFPHSKQNIAGTAPIEVTRAEQTNKQVVF